jgi:hypothetical protein
LLESAKSSVLSVTRSTHGAFITIAVLRLPLYSRFRQESILLSTDALFLASIPGCAAVMDTLACSGVDKQVAQSLQLPAPGTIQAVGVQACGDAVLSQLAVTCWAASIAAVALHRRNGDCETEASCYRGTERGLSGTLAVCALNAFCGLSI